MVLSDEINVKYGSVEIMEFMGWEFLYYTSGMDQSSSI